MATQLIGKRIRALREERNLSQENVAEIFGFNDRQTVSAIETGARRVTAGGTTACGRKAGRPVGVFYRSVPARGRRAFFLAADRASPPICSKPTNAAPDAGSPRSAPWRPEVGFEAPLMRRALGLTRPSSFEDAMRAGERFVSAFDLGDAPATYLAGRHGTRTRYPRSPGRRLSRQSRARLAACPN